MTDNRGLSVVVGYAGTGKSAMLERGARAELAIPFAVPPCPALQPKGWSMVPAPSHTIASLEHQWGQGRELLTSRDVLVIDEAGMVGTRQMERVLAHAADAGAVVLVGDPQQLQAIEARTAFRVIHEQHGGVEISEVRRQRDELAAGRHAALATGRTGLPFRPMASAIWCMPPKRRAAHAAS